jgi:hypothetical protein
MDSKISQSYLQRYIEMFYLDNIAPEEKNITSAEKISIHGKSKTAIK